MLRFLTRSIRRRVGRVIALAYLACVIAPALALAFADPAVAAHCLTADHHTQAAASVHVHSDGGAHRHSDAAMHRHADGTEHRHDHSGPTDDGDSGGAPAAVQCCGLFCLNATAANGFAALVATTMHGRTLQPALEAPLGGIGPFRIERPPNVLA